MRDTQPKKLTHGIGVILGVVLVFVPGITLLKSFTFVFEAWSVIPSNWFYGVFIICIPFGALLFIYSGNKLASQRSFGVKCAICGGLLSFLFMITPGATHLLFADWYLRCEFNEAVGCYSVGRAHLDELILWSDVEEGMKYLQKSCEYGSWSGCVAVLEQSQKPFPAACEMLNYCAENAEGRIGAEETQNIPACRLYHATCEKI